MLRPRGQGQVITLSDSSYPNTHSHPEWWRPCFLSPSCPLPRLDPRPFRHPDARILADSSALGKIGHQTLKGRQRGAAMRDRTGQK